MSSKKSIAVMSVNASRAKGTPKEPVGEIELKEGVGVVGDAHAGSSREVSLLDWSEIEAMAPLLPEGLSPRPGLFAENITTSGMDFPLRVGDRLRCGRILLEVSSIGKECHGHGCAIFKAAGSCVMPLKGVFARVLSGGRLRAGDVLEVEEEGGA